MKYVMLKKNIFLILSISAMLLFFISSRTKIETEDVLVYYYGFPFQWYGADGAGSLDFSVSLGRLVANFTIYLAISYIILLIVLGHLTRKYFARKAINTLGLIAVIPAVFIMVLSDRFYAWSFPIESQVSDVNKHNEIILGYRIRNYWEEPDSR